MNDLDVFFGLINGLKRISIEQQKDGGWGTRKNENLSYPEGTGHIVQQLLQMFDLDLNLIEPALLFIENNYKRSKNNIGYWPVYYSLKQDQCIDFLCCYSLLKSEELGRELKKLNHKEVLKTALFNIARVQENLEKGDWSSGKGSFWQVQIISYILILKCFSKKTKKQWNEILTQKTALFEIWKNAPRLDEIAKVLLGALTIEDISFESKHAMVQFLLEKKIEEKIHNSKYFYWTDTTKNSKSQRESDFHITRWVLLALEESYKKKIFTDKNEKIRLFNVINKGVIWITSIQSANGFWPNNQNKYIPPYSCGYAILTQWKWLEIKEVISNDFIINTLKIIINSAKDSSKVPVESNGSIKKKLSRYQKIFFIFLSIIIVQALFLIGWDTIIKFFEANSKTIFIVGTIISIPASILTIYLALRKN